MNSKVLTSLPVCAQAVGIVDPSSGGRFIAERLELLGITVVRLDSDREMDERQKALFRDADMDSVAILAGAESGVVAAEKWARENGLRGNDPATSPIRRIKHRMAEALSRSGVPVCRQALHTDTGAAEEWAARVGYPIVVKPPESSGSDLVRMCRSPEELTQAIELVVNGKTKYDKISEGALIQEFMEGEEYTVDGVVFDGKLIIFSIGKYNKIQNADGFVYDNIQFFKEGSAGNDKVIVDYAHDVVRALEVRVGAVHIEIMMTERGPLLVELAARPHGGIATTVIDESVDPKFTDAIVCSHLGGSFQSFAQISLVKHSIIFFAKTPKPGVVKDVPGKERVRTLASYSRAVWLAEAGDELVKTVDLASCPALIHLAHSDRDILQADLQTLVALDASGELLRLEGEVSGHA